MAPAVPRKLEAVVRAHIRELRAARGLTQEQLCERAGISVDAVSRIEGGSRVPTLDTLARLARALAVSPSALLENPGQHTRAAEPKRASTATRICAALDGQPDEVQRLAERAVASVVRAFAVGQHVRHRERN